MSVVTPPCSRTDQNGDPRRRRPATSQSNATHVLLYVGADRSPRRHASCNAATARIDRSGIDKAKLAVLCSIVDRVANLPAGQVPFHELDPARVANDAARRLVDNSPLAAPFDSAEEFRSRLQQLAYLREERASAHQPELAAAANDSVTSALEPVRAALAAMQDANPLALQNVCDAGRKHIGEMKYVDHSPVAANGLARVRDALAMVTSPASPVPQHKRETVVRHLVAAANDAVRGELSLLAGQAAMRRIRREMHQLADELRERSGLSQACRKHLDEAMQLLRNRCDETTSLALDGDTAGEILLPGPTAEAVFNALTRQMQCSRADVIERLCEAYTQRVAGEGRDLVAEGRGPLGALAALSPQASVSAIDDILQPHLREFTIYQAARQYGPTRLAEELYARAEPLLHLCRESILLNVELTSVTIADLPRAETKDDEAVRAELQACLERHPPVNVRETPPSTDDLQVVRSLACYSAALLADNDSLAVAYVESRRLEHRPHLFGVLADVPDGLASELLVETFHQLQPQELCHDDCNPSHHPPASGD